MANGKLEELIGQQPSDVGPFRRISIRGKGKSAKATLVFYDGLPSIQKIAEDIAEAINALGIDNVHADSVLGDNKNNYQIMDINGPNPRTAFWYDLLREGNKITITPMKGRIGTYNQSDFLQAYVRRLREISRG